VRVTIADGFPGQKLIVLPRPHVSAALGRPGTSHLVVTDCGYFPEARAHGRSRTTGIDQAIVAICIRGRGWCQIGGERHDVGPGQVFVVPPGFAHRYEADLDDPWTLWWVHIAGPDLLELLRTSGLTSSSPVREVSDVYRLVALVEEIVRVLERDATEPSMLAASGAAWHLLSLLLATSRPPGDMESPLDRAREYIQEHVAADLSVSRLAEIANLSASHFAALFRQRFGIPVLRYQTQLRMSRARELLDTTGRTIGTIAQDVGYPDAAYFSRQFTAVHGLSPRGYRAQQKG
jgi:AraC-like DNA-binding protein